MTSGRPGRLAGALLLFDGVLALCLVICPAPAAPGVLRMLAAALATLVLPGAAWLGLFRRRPLDPPRLALAVVGMSSLASVIGAALCALVTHGPSRGLMAAWLGAVVTAGLLACGPPPRPAGGHRWGWLAGLAAVGFLLAAAAGLYLVPPLEDHDMEVRGTAVGLLTDFKPYLLTNREVLFGFSHPVLFHFPVAQSLLLTGEIDQARPSYDSARRAEADLAAGRPFDWSGAWQANHAAFVARPALAGTRAPAALFSGLVVALLGALVLSLTGSRLAGTLAAVFYVTCPETIVRASYAGYFSVSVFAMLCAALLLPAGGGGGDAHAGRAGAGSGARSPGALPRGAFRPGTLTAGGWLIGAGAFMALVDHKTVVLLLGLAAAVLFRRVRPAGALPLAIGFALGTAAWWGYGLAVDATAFIRDHLRMHIAHRMLLDDWRLLPDPSRYSPSMIELWGQFAAHTGFVFVAAASIGIAAWTLGRTPPGEAADQRLAALAGWVIAGCAAFTLTDWRQTKHLMNQLAPMVAAALVIAWPALARWRGAAPGGGQGPGRGGFRLLPHMAALLLAVAFVVNLATDARLLADFRSLTILGASDIDGW